MAQPTFSCASMIVNPGDTYPLLTATTLNLDATKEAFENGKRAYTAQKYEDAVKHYTRALEAMHADISAAIHIHRAAAYEMQNKYDLAIDDCKAANPNNGVTCPDSYFARGNALLLSNQLRESADEYQRGANNVVPQTIPQRDMLAVKHQQVMSFIDYKNQHMIRALPYEVVCRILSQLSLTERKLLGKTCRFWNNYMFRKWPQMWSEVYLDPTMQSSKAIRGEQVRHLHMDFTNFGYNQRLDFEKLNAINAMLNFLDERWDGVESLTLTHCDKTSHVEKLSRIVSKSLKTLTLLDSTESNNYGINVLKSAVHNCAKLETIRNQLTDYIARNPPPPLLHYVRSVAQLSNFQLTSLWLTKKVDNFDQICQHLPALKSITINSAPPKDTRYEVLDYAIMLDTVHKYCPALETLKYGPYGNRVVYAIHTLSSTTDTGGLKTLAIRPREINRDTNVNPHLALIFQKASKSLQTLDLPLDLLENGQFSALDTLIQFGAPQMRTLIIDGSSKCTIGSQKIASLISACPSLVTIKLAGANFWHSRIFHELANLTQLQTASINEVIREVPDTPRQCVRGGDNRVIREIPDTRGQCVRAEDLQMFLSRAKNLHDFSFVFSNDKKDCSSWIASKDYLLRVTRAISLTTVRTLDLGTIALTCETLLPVMESLKDSQVQTLKIGVSGSLFVDRVCDAIANIRCLTHLVIYDDDFLLTCFGVGAITEILDKWQHPQMLFIHVIFLRRPSCYFETMYKADIGTRQQRRSQMEDLKNEYRRFGNYPW